MRVKGLEFGNSAEVKGKRLGVKALHGTEEAELTCSLFTFETDAY